MIRPAALSLVSIFFVAVPLLAAAIPQERDAALVPSRLFPAPEGHEASRVVFVCDAPESMRDKYQTLHTELQKTIDAMVPVQSFNVLFTESEGYWRVDKSLLRATPDNKQKVHDFLGKFSPRGTTDAIPALEAAFALKPEVIYLLADGDFANIAAVQQRIRELNKDQKVSVITVAFLGESDDRRDFMAPLAEIARENGGVFTRVNQSDLLPGATTRPADGSIFSLPTDAREVRRIVFVMDASGSMLNKFGSLRHGLMRALDQLGPQQSFNLVFFQEENALALDEKQMLAATRQNKAAAQQFISEKVTPRGTTNPIPGLQLAFAQKPDMVFLLTDGDFPDNEAVAKAISDLNRDHKARISTVAFVGEGDNDQQFIVLLKKIAHANGGRYARVNEADVQPWNEQN